MWHKLASILWCHFIAEESPRDVNTSADIYAFGILMWELTCIPNQQSLYGCMLSETIIDGVLEKEMRPQFLPDVPQEYQELAAK